MAYLRDTPVQSLKVPTANRSPLCAAISLRSAPMAARVKDQVFAHADQFLLAQQDLKQAPRARRFDAGLPERLSQRGNRQAGPKEQLLDARQRLRLVLFEGQPVRGQAHDLALAGDFLARRQQRVEQERRRGGEFPAPQLLLRHAGCERIPAMKFAQRVPDARQNPVEPAPVAQPRVRRANPYQARVAGGGFELVLGQPATGNQLAEAGARRRFGHHQRHAVGRAAVGQDVEPPVRFLRPDASGSVDVEHRSAADGDDGREHPNYKAVARKRQDRLAQQEAHPRFGPRLKRRAPVEQARLGLHLRRSQVEMDRGSVLQRLGRSEQLEPAVELTRRVKNAGRGQRHSPADFQRLDARDVERGALSGHRARDRRAVDLNAAHAQSLARRVKFDFLLERHRARPPACP